MSKKKVLVISSSPRKGGNSDLLCDEFLGGATEAGHSAEKIFLKDKKIGYCSGCGVCFANGKKGCSQKDDMAEILDKMIAADVIVMATPIYFYTMCGQLKAFIDRCCAKYTEIKNKDFYFIMAAADTNKTAMDKAITEFHGFTEDCLEGANEKGVIKAVGVWKAGDVKGKVFMAEAYKMGKEV